MRLDDLSHLDSTLYAPVSLCARPPPSNGVLGLCIAMCGLSTGVMAALVAYYGYDSDWRPWAGVGFVCGSILMVVVSEVVESAIIALFICLADDPATMQRTRPDEYHRLIDPINVYCQTTTNACTRGARVEMRAR